MAQGAKPGEGGHLPKFIGHILYDAKLIYADQEKALELDSKVGSRSGDIDYSLLLDGLMAEREQGITIDVAYRYFTTDNRSFIVADTPGHRHRTGFETGNIQAVMDGDLDGFINAYLKCASLGTLQK